MLHVRNERGSDNDINQTVAKDLIRNVELAAFRVVGDRLHEQSPKFVAIFAVELAPKLHSVPLAPILNCVFAAAGAK